jgi:hypothetical protein
MIPTSLSRNVYRRGDRGAPDGRAKDLLDGHLDHLRDATYRKYFGID